MKCIKFTLLIVSLVYPAAFACGGYKLNLKSVKNCGGGSDALQLSDDFTSTLTPDCLVKPSGCVTTTQSLKEVKVTYDVMKNGMMPLKGTVDGCKEMEKADEKTIELVMTLVGIPPECPIPEGKRCANETTSIDISKHKSKMTAAAGKYKGKLTSDHGDGLKSCIEFEAVLDR